jgi:formylglycine-generating enzyme required for sulfatase activity
MRQAIDKLRELRALHDDGLLSREEFDGLKSAILDEAHAAGAVPSGSPSASVPAGTEVGLMAGQEVGPPNRRYRLERLIAHGGMGQVWRATDLATRAQLGHSDQVALKILAPHLTAQSAHARLLIEEAARARQLAHQHIVRVYDWAQDPATTSYFLIMECLDGEDFDSLLAREGPLPPARALALLAPVADALDYAWERHNLVHRDLKPANVFVTRGGEVKLLDFGIAARARGTAPPSGTEAAPNAGTPGYRAPAAQAGAAPPDRAQDVYALAAMLYQMVTGHLPFGAARGLDDEAPRPDALDDAQWAALQAGFAFDAAARPASVRALLDGLAPAPLPSAEELQARAEAVRRAAAEEAKADALRRERERQATEELAIRRQRELEAAAAAKAQAERQRREGERLARLAEDEARRLRKEELRRQLAQRRDAEAEKARMEREEAQRRAVQAKAASAQLAEQARARAEQAARHETELAALLPTPDSPVADTEGILRDRFLDSAAKGPELVLLPTGRFQMGSPDHERKIAMAAGSQPGWLARELPQHWVGIARPIAMGRYPVTVGEWRAFAAATGWRASGDVDWDAPGFPQTDRHPVVGVNWFDAIRYVRWLTEVTGRTYRLPSEAEWEYACRAGTRTAFSWGDTIGTDQANYDGTFTYNGGPRGECRRGTTPVGTFAANPWGLFDMHGNVWEWVQDVVHDNYEGAPVDGSAWEEGGDAARRILRGGSWLYNPRYLRAALRNGFSAILSNDIVGLRVVRELM